MTSSTSAITVRPVQEGDLPAIANLDRLSFAPLSSDEVILSEWYGGILSLPGRELFLAVEPNHLPVGTYAQLDLGIWFNGQTIPTMGIAAVAVAPHRRGQRVARLMLEHALAIGKQKQIPLIALYPFQHGFYRNLGWAWVGRSQQYRVATQHLPSYPQRSHIYPYQAAPHQESLKQVYETAASQHNGWLERREWQWTSRLKPEKGKEIYVYREGAELSGYVIFHFLDLPAPDNTLVVVVDEWVALNVQAYRGILGFLASLRDQIGTIVWNTDSQDPFPHMLREQRQSPDLVESAFHFGLVHNFGKIGGGFMWRLVDLEQAFGRRSIHAVSPFALTFQVTDPILGNQQITVEFANRRMQIAQQPVAEVVTISIEHLTALFAGMRQATDLLWSGEISYSGDSALLAQLDQAWQTPPPFCWDFF